MDAVFKIKGTEFNATLFKKIKSLLGKKGNANVVIQVTDEEEAYHRALQKSISELSEPDKLISFSMEGLEEYTSKKKHK